jgi:hypothetical protein
VGPERIRAFADRSYEFYDRLAAADADMGFGTPAVTLLQRDVTIGLFASYACLEWHLHAHDLAVSAGVTYQVADMTPIRRALDIVIPGIAEDLQVSWSECVAGSGRTPS